MSATQGEPSTQDSASSEIPSTGEGVSTSAGNASVSTADTQAESQSCQEEAAPVTSTSTTETAIPATQSSIEPQPGPSGEQRVNEVDGIQIPEGVDPSFLAALPESIRYDFHIYLNP